MNNGAFQRLRFKNLPDRWVSAIYGLVVLLLIATGLLLQQRMSQLGARLNQRRTVRQASFDVMAALSLLQEAESSQRGYLLT